MLRNFLYILTFGVFIACVDSAEDVQSDRLNVEAYVEPGKAPIVFLTEALPIEGFDDIDFLSSIESTAKVEISDGNQTEIARFTKDDDQFPSRFYTFENILGDLDVQYELTITVNQKQYKANTLIPRAPELLSAELVASPELDSDYNVRLELQNFEMPLFYKIYIKEVNEESYTKSDPFVFSNELITADQWVIFFNYWSFQENQEQVSLLDVENAYDLRIVAITKAEFDFWEVVLGSQTDLVNLPSFSQEVPSNISNDAFGFFSGNYGIDTVINN